MRYDRIYKAKFIERPNRFIAYAELNGKKETVHVKNKEDAPSFFGREQIFIFRKAIIRPERQGGT